MSSAGLVGVLSRNPQSESSVRFLSRIPQSESSVEVLRRSPQIDSSLGVFSGSSQWESSDGVVGVLRWSPQSESSVGVVGVLRWSPQSESSGRVLSRGPQVWDITPRLLNFCINWQFLFPILTFHKFSPSQYWKWQEMVQDTFYRVGHFFRRKYICKKRCQILTYLERI